MADSPRVAVYLDFDNIVISRYDHVHGNGTWRADEARKHAGDSQSKDPIDVKLAQAQVDLSAIIDYATSFGTVAITRAYADWSVRANAAYRRQLIDRSVDLVQLFAASGTKNGADIRLSVDAVDDLFRHTDISHVVLVAGDSDYVPLAQRCKTMGRYVVGIGVAGSTSSALVSACDEFTAYFDMPGIEPDPAPETRSKKVAQAAKDGAKSGSAGTEEPPALRQATALLRRAVRVGLEKSDDDWLFAGGVKSQMQRMDSSFKEKSLGFSSFRDFVESRTEVVETRMEGKQLQVRARPR